MEILAEFEVASDQQTDCEEMAGGQGKFDGEKREGDGDGDGDTTLTGPARRLIHDLMRTMKDQ